MVLAESKILKQFGVQWFLQLVELLRCLKTWEFLVFVEISTSTGDPI